MYNIYKKGNSLFKADGGDHEIFVDSDEESDDEDKNLRREYLFKALGLRGDSSKKKASRMMRGKGIATISDNV